MATELPAYPAGNYTNGTHYFTGFGRFFAWDGKWVPVPPAPVGTHVRGSRPTVGTIAYNDSTDAPVARLHETGVWRFLAPTSSKKGTQPMHADPTEKLRSRLDRLGYVTNDKRLLQQTHLLLEDAAHARTGGRIPAMICDGPPGTGKTELAKTFAKLFRAKHFLRIQLVRGVGIDRLMYDLDIPAIISAQASQDTTFSVQDALKPGILWKALELSRTERVVLLLDELDKAQEYVDSFLLEFLNDGVISDPADSGHVISGIAKNLVVFLTKNKERPLSEPLMRRCRRVYFNWPDATTEALLVRKLVQRQTANLATTGNVEKLTSVVVRLANTLRTYEGKMLKVPSTPELANAVADMLQVPSPHWGDLLHSWFFAYASDAKDIVREHKEFSAERLGQALLVSGGAL